MENIAADIFNAILIGCQLFDDNERIERFVNAYSTNLSEESLKECLSDFNINYKDALERLKHGFGVHFTTSKTAEKIMKAGHLAGYGKNEMFSPEVDEVIKKAAFEQQNNDPNARDNLNYLFRGFGTGVSSYGSLTNGFWMYHTPESLSFLFGTISDRDKKHAMNHVLRNISALSDENKKKTFETMSNLYDDIIGDEQNVCCVLIDCDDLDYEVDYYYNGPTPTAIERRPYNHNFSSIFDNDKRIGNDIDASKLKFVKIPTIKQLELEKQTRLASSYSDPKR